MKGSNGGELFTNTHIYKQVFVGGVGERVSEKCVAMGKYHQDLVYVCVYVCVHESTLTNAFDDLSCRFPFPKTHLCR